MERLAMDGDAESTADTATAGVATLVLTDIVGSVQLIEELGDERWTALWREHDGAARALLQQFGGREIEKTDGFLLLFPQALLAAGFVLAYHEALARLSVPLASRAGVHTGPYRLRHNAAADCARGARPLEMDGMARSLLARVMTLAAGGQTLLSDSAQAALAGELSSAQGETSLQLRSHGHWRLKGLAEPIELFELAPRAGAFEPPLDSAKAYRVCWQAGLWRPVRELRHTLPTERDPFVGRHEVLSELARRFDDDARLVSLLGIGGAGKTRAALHYGHRWLGDYDGGAWFCDLASARDADGVTRAVTQGLELPPVSGDPVVAIGQAIAARGRCLVILDNFEQVWAHAEGTVGRWLGMSAEACFLVTTREALSIAGEQVMALPPLPSAEAEALFRQRSTSLGGRLGPADDPALPALVALLDGLPLALELAAARTLILKPAELLARMKDRFRLLAVGGGRRDRQATLRATLDWSWDLLTEGERSALAQLSVFEGGFTLAAAEAVLDLSACADAPWAVDVVQSLARKSFLRTGRGQRLELLNSVQDYAADHLASVGRFPGSGPAAALATQRRHWQHFAALEVRTAVAERCAEQDNLTAACRRAASHGDAAAATGALVLAWVARQRTGPFQAGLELAAAVEAAGPLTAAQQAAREWVVGSARLVLGQAEAAAQALDAGLAHALEAADPRLQAWLRCQRGTLFMRTGAIAKAADEVRRAATLAQGLDDPLLQCTVLNAQGSLASGVDAPDVARRHYAAALTLAEAMGDQRWAGGLNGNLGALAHLQGRFEDALRHYAAALEQTERAGERRWEANARCNLGLLFHDLGRPADAEREFAIALTAAHAMADTRLEATAHCNLGLAAEAQGRGDEALGRFNRAVSMALSTGHAHIEGQFRTCRGRLLARRSDFTGAQHDLDRADELLAATDDALGSSLVQCARAEWALLQERHAEARAALARAEAQLPATPGARTMSELARECARLREMLVDVGRSTSAVSQTFHAEPSA